MHLNNDFKRLSTGLLILGVALFVGRISAREATEQSDKTTDKSAASGQSPQLSAESYSKFRVEVELRGKLHSTEKGDSLTALWRTYELYHEDKEVSGAAAPATWALDFSRAKQLQPTARSWDGKDVVIVGQSELRMVVQPLPPGGTGGSGLAPNTLPSPTWSAHPTVIVSGIRLPNPLGHPDEGRGW